MKPLFASKKFFAILFFFIFVFFNTGLIPVYAQDIPPVEPAVEQESVPPAEEQPAPPVEEQPTIPPVEPAIEQPEIVESPVTSSVEEAPTVPEVLEQIPEDTGILVIGDNGEVEPLASQDAADDLLTSDPMWCPEGGGTCYNHTTLTGLIGLLTSAGIISGSATPVNGIMYFTPTYLGGDDLIFDNSGSGNMHGLGNLTIQGGWDGETTGAPNVTATPSTFATKLIVRNWTNNIFINNVNSNIDIINLHTDASGSSSGIGLSDISGNVLILNSIISGASVSGLEADRINGTLEVAGSTFDNNLGKGADISEVTGDVTISNSSFNTNDEQGLLIGSLCNNSEGVPDAAACANVNLYHDTIDGNSDAGLFITQVGDVTITDSSVSENHQESAGLYNFIYDAQDVTVIHGTFNKNGQMDAGGGEVSYSAGSGLIVDWGTWASSFSAYSDIGFPDIVNTPGNLNVSSSTFNNNATYGLVYSGLFSVADSPPDYIKDTFVVISDSEMSGNYSGNGLNLSGAGTIILDNLIVNNNGDNNINLTKSDQVIITDITASDGGCSGISIMAIGSANVSNVTTDRNGCMGVGIFGTLGDISLSNVFTNENVNFGAYLAFIGGSLQGTEITANANGDEGSGSGFFAASVTGDIILSNVTANDNIGAGMIIAKDFGFGSSQSNEIETKSTSTTSLPGMGNVVLTNITTNNNSVDGLDVAYVAGNVTGKNIQSNGNGNYGIYISNIYGGINSIQSANFVSPGNGGNVTLTNITASNNGSDGLYLNNIFGKTTITCSNFDNNGGVGIFGEYLNDVSLNGGPYDFYFGEDNYQVGGNLNKSSGCNVSSDPHPILPDWKKSDGRIVPVQGGESISLICGYSWTTLILPNDDAATFTGPCGGDLTATLNPRNNSNLPGAIPEGYSFGGSFTANMLQGSTVQEVLPGGGTIGLSFVVPEELQGKELFILYWDEALNTWIEIPLLGGEDTFTTSTPGMKVLNGVSIGPDGKVIATLNFSGTFLLVAK